MITIDGEWFKDKEGRYLIFRGVNLPAKTPEKPYCPTNESSHRFVHEKVSFVNRPLPLDEADEHFARLKHLGFTLLRLVVTWEGIEHDGPGKYDLAYLDYIEALVKKAGEWDLRLFIDLHQDVWSRFSGGDGAPGWTLEKVGFEMARFEETGAAVFHDPNSDISHLLWPTNAFKLTASTMFTLFFGGNEFAPKRQIEGIPVQEFLQSHYIHALMKVVERLKGMSHVIGYDLMNEPYPGYIGCPYLGKIYGPFQLGDSPTPFQSMLLGDGFSTRVDVWGKALFRLKKVGARELNSNNARAWQAGEMCVWREAGVWGIHSKGHPVLLKPGYFKGYKFEKDFYRPFIKRAVKEIHSISKTSMIFVEPVMGIKASNISAREFPNLVHTGHWYDGFVLATKRFYSFIGFDPIKMKCIFALPRWMRRAFSSQIQKLKRKNAPFVVSEFGVPFDLGNKKSYKTGNFKKQSKALHRSFTAIDDNLASAVVWNYSFDNTNREGDHWNGEDLSIFSRDQQTDPDEHHSGIRAKDAIIRPYCMKSSGIPIYMHFFWKKGIFEYIFRHDPTIDSPTEIFLPKLHFGGGFTIEYTNGTYEIDHQKQIFRYFPEKTEKYHLIRIAKKRRFG